jgi:hypothetical protein
VPLSSEEQPGCDYTAVGSFEEKYKLYYENNIPEIEWPLAADAVSVGEPTDQFFTLPWRRTESRSVFLYGVSYNRARITELRSLKVEGSRARKRRHVGVLYPGVPDEWTSEAVGVATRAGHVGCLEGAMCSAGIGRLVRTLQARGVHFVVPIDIAASGDISIPLPEGQDLSAFDYPWVGSDPDRYAKPPRINRSNVMGLLMLKHGTGARWRRLATRISSLDESAGVSVSERFPRVSGSRIMVNLRDDATEEAIAKAARLVDFEVVERPRGFIDKERAKALGQIDALVTRYPDSDVPVCQFARSYGIPIYRAAEFIGSLSEAVLDGYE